MLVVAATVRLLWVAYAARAPQAGDPFAYLYYGNEIASGRGYLSITFGMLEASAALADPSYAPDPTPATAFYPIGYPAMVAAVAWIVQHTPLPDDLPNAVGVVQAFLGVGTVAMVYALARRLLDDTVALVAAGIVALFPELIFYTAVAFAETLFTFLVVAVLLAVVWQPWDHGRLSLRVLVVAGLLLGISAQVRPFTLLFVPVLAALWWAHGAGWRRTLVQTGVLALAVVCVLTPWTVRNQQRLDAFVPISTNLGDTVCISRSPGAIGGSRNGYFDATGCRHPDPTAASDEHFEVRNNRENFEGALDFVRENPRSELSLQVQRLFYSFAGSHQVLTDLEQPEPFMPSGLREVLSTSSDAYFYMVGLMALLGAPILMRGRDPRRQFLLLATVALVATVPLLLYGLERFHVPVLPLLAIVAATPLHAALRASWRPDALRLWQGRAVSARRGQESTNQAG